LERGWGWGEAIQRTASIVKKNINGFNVNPMNTVLEENKE
jgi:hypothetical protein